MGLPAPLLAGRYRLVSVIASGGMGVVWEAWDERLERSVAVKQLRSLQGVPEAEAELAKNRAMREARITARLHHPHAVPVFDVVEHDGQPCLIMPLLPSTPLSALLRESGPLPLGRVARIGTEIASALAAAHELGIVHRDVKPGNILITTDGAAHISDFGISHAMGDATLTSTGLVHGTPAYLAPEVARGAEASFLSDVFSLGSTLYAALEGAPPFGSDVNSLALLHKVAAARVPPPTRAGDLTHFLLDMLSATPESRPTMRVVASHLAELPTDAAPAEETAAAPRAATTSAAAVGPLTGETTQELQPASGQDADPPAAGGPHVGAASPLPWWFFTRDSSGESAAERDGLAAAAAERDGLAAAAAVSGAGATHRAAAAPPGRTDGAPGPGSVRTPAPSTARPASEGTSRPARPARPARAAVLSVAAAVAALVLVLAAAVTDDLRRDPAREEGGAAAPATSVAEPSSDVGVAPAPRVLPTPRPADETPSASTAEPGPSAQAEPQPTPEPGPDAATAPEPEPEPEVATEPQADAEPEVQAEAEAEPAPSAQPEPSAEPVAAPASPDRTVQLASAISDYYALMPDNVGEAWPRMTADYQTNHAGGFTSYESFWNTIADVAVSDIEATPPDRVAATLTYVFHDGRVDVERTAYRMVDEGGLLKIAASEVLSSRSG